jgi:Tetratricopeptide repeat
LRAVNNLAGTVAALSDAYAAGAMLHETIATLTRVFGDEDGDTLTAMANLAALLWQCGERDDAFVLQERVFDALHRTRGTDDPATRDARAVLDSMLREIEF